MVLGIPNGYVDSTWRTRILEELDEVLECVKALSSLGPAIRCDPEAGWKPERDSESEQNSHQAWSWETSSSQITSFSAFWNLHLGEERQPMDKNE